jgi:formate hydrogenlyase subunit 3/multisubunit Na+/H+ antiporter MnhD subunit
MIVDILLLSGVFLPSFAAMLILVFQGRHKAFIAVSASISLFLILLCTKIVLGSDMRIIAALNITPSIEISFAFERFGMFFALISSFLWVITNFYSIDYLVINQIPGRAKFLSYFCLSMTCVMGVAFAGNLITLFVFYELLTITTYPLVTFKKSSEASRAGRIYLLMLFGSSLLFFFLAIVMTFNFAGTLDFVEGGILPQMSPAKSTLLLLLFAYGVGKAALVPMHSWLPRAMVAPSPVSAFLHAVAVVKAGVFTIIKIIVYIFGIDNLCLCMQEATNILLYIAGLSTIFSTLMALRQDNLKRMLAYSTVSQLSYMIMSAALLSSAAVEAAFFHLLAHAFAKITLFFAVGAIYSFSGRQYISDLNGIAQKLPLTMFAFAIAALSMIGLPPAVGVLSKFFIIKAGYKNLFLLSVTLISTIANAFYFLPALYRAFFCKLRGAHIRNESVLLAIPAVVTSCCLILLFFSSNLVFSLL